MTVAVWCRVMDRTDSGAGQVGSPTAQHRRNLGPRDLEDPQVGQGARASKSRSSENRLGFVR